MVATDDGAGSHSRATGPRLILHTSLIGTHKKATVGHILDKIHIRSLREFLDNVPDSTTFSHHVEVLQVVDSLHIVRRAGIQKPPVQAAAHIGGGDATHTQFHDAYPTVLVPHHNLRSMWTVESFEMKSL